MQRIAVLLLFGASVLGGCAAAPTTTNFPSEEVRAFREVEEGVTPSYNERVAERRADVISRRLRQLSDWNTELDRLRRDRDRYPLGSAQYEQRNTRLKHLDTEWRAAKAAVQELIQRDNVLWSQSLSALDRRFQKVNDDFGALAR